MALTSAEMVAWIRVAADRKGIADTELAAPLTEALNALYSAVAFDIDGTLTLPDSADLDPAMCAIVARLLRRGCHVWLVTGRGSSGAVKAANELVNKTDLEPDECLRLRCIAHNGASVLSVDPAQPSLLLGPARPLIEAFGLIVQLEEDAEAALREAAIVSKSLTLEPSRADEACGLRIVFTDLDDRNRAVEALTPITANYGPPLQVRTGVYQDFYTIDVTTADKARAVSVLAENHRLDPTRVLCIGDQGGPDGNDGSFLAAATGFSVGTVSNSAVGCFPVVSSDGELLQGSVATLRLVDALCIGAPLRMSIGSEDGASASEQRARLLSFERAAVRRASAETRMIERQLSVRVAQLIAHDPGDGDFRLTVGDLFDPRSGGVRIRDWELDDLQQYPKVCRLFAFDALARSSLDDDGPDRCMYTDSGVLLRGPDYYMNLTGRRSADDVPDYLQRGEAFLQDALDAVDELIAHRPTTVLVRVALAIMDNVRDMMLQLLNIALFVAQPPGSTDEDDHALVGGLGELAADHICRYVDFLLEPHSPWSTTLSTCRNPIQGLHSWVIEHRTRLSGRVAECALQPEWEKGDKKDVFRWREADDLVQNLSAVVIGLRAVAGRKSESTADPILAVGLQYGGLELPLLAAALAPRFGLTLIPAVMRISMYSNREQGDRARDNLDDWVSTTDPALFPVVVLGAENTYESADHRYTDVVLLDDCCTTGGTVQAARDMLVRRGCDVRAVVIVRFPGTNRFAHMALPAHGMLDLDLAHNFVQGLVGPSPYSRLVVPQTTHKNRYEDENGVFDKAKLRIRLLLHKNSPNRWPMPEVHAWGSASTP